MGNPDKTPLTEEEVKILHEQLIKKQEELKEQQAAARLQEEENETRYKLLHKREIEFMERERQQIEQLNATQAQLFESQIKLEQPQKHLDTKGAIPRTNYQTTDSRLEELLTGLKNDFASLQQEVAVLRVSQSGCSTPSKVPFIAKDQEPPPNNNSTVTAISPNLSCKDAMESIPVFTGENMSVLKFARACKRAKEMFAPTFEPTLARLLSTKLKGRAYTAVEDDTFLTVSDFVDRLKTIFGAAKSVNQFRGELGNARKGGSEHIIDYISRIKDLHTAIIDAETTNGVALSRDRLTELETETLGSFVLGLPPDYRVRLRLEGYKDLKSAYAVAIKIEKEIEHDRLYFEQSRSELRPKTTAPQIEVNVTQSDKPQCEHCNKPGHIIENCWLKYPDKRPPRRVTGPAATNATFNDEKPKCSYCNKPGHKADDCYSRQRDEKKRLSGNEQQRLTQSGASRTEQTMERPIHFAQTYELSEQ